MIEQMHWGCPPMRSSNPGELAPVSVDEEREVAVVEQEFSVHSLNVNRLHILLACDKIKRSIRLIQKGLRLSSLKTYYLKPTSASYTKSRAEEMDGR